MFVKVIWELFCCLSLCFSDFISIILSDDMVAGSRFSYILSASVKIMVSFD